MIKLKISSPANTFQAPRPTATHPAFTTTSQCPKSGLIKSKISQALSDVAIGRFVTSNARHTTDPQDRPKFKSNLKNNMLRLNTMEDTTHLPKGIMLDEHKFKPWKDRMDATLASCGLPDMDDGRLLGEDDESWKARSELAARALHPFVPTGLLKQLRPINLYDHGKLMRKLELLTLRFRFMKLPKVVRNRVYSFVDEVCYAPLQKKTSGYAALLRVSKEVREEALAGAPGYNRCRTLRNPKRLRDYRATGNSPPSATSTYLHPLEHGLTMDDAGKDQLHKVEVEMQVQSIKDEANSHLHWVSIERPDPGDEGVVGCSFCLNDKGGNPSESYERHVKEFAAKIALEQKALGLGGKGLIIALLREDALWKHGELEC